MQLLRDFLNDLIRPDVSIGMVHWLIEIALHDKEFNAHDLSGNMRDKLPQAMVKMGYAQRDLSGNNWKYVLTPKMEALRALLRGGDPKKTLQTEGAPPQPAPVATLPKPAPPINAPDAGPVPPIAATSAAIDYLPGFAGGARKFMLRTPAQHAAVIRQWGAMDFDQALGTQLAEVCYRLSQGEIVPATEKLQEAARNAEVIAVRLYGN